MPLLFDVVPEFASEVAAVLEAEGFPHLRERVLTATIEDWSYDASINWGYIRILQIRPGSLTWQCAPETVAIAAPHWFNVNIGYDGDILGIELAGRTDLVDRLSAACAPEPGVQADPPSAGRLTQSVRPHVHP